MKLKTMLKKANKLLVCSLLLLTFAGCRRVPSDVIQPEEMAQLMADIHTGEAVVDMNRTDYMTDSAKLVMKQSIYVRHGVTGEEVDSSMAWYGRNIMRYMDVYDRTIEILEQRTNEMGNRVAAEAAMSMAGDSVDVWSHPRYLVLSDLSPTMIFTFGYKADENWEKGDVYTWRAKFLTSGATNDWNLTMSYDDGAVETMNNSFTDDGWHEIILRTDSTRIPIRLTGFMYTDASETHVRIDSVELVRKRLDSDNYHRRYLQRTVATYQANDSIAQ